MKFTSTRSHTVHCRVKILLVLKRHLDVKMHLLKAEHLKYNQSFNKK